MSAQFAVTMTVVLAAGLAAVVLVAVQRYADGQRWWQLLPSMLPLALIAGAVLVVASGGK